MLDTGFGLAERLLRFPKPVVAACNGHAIAMAAFLLNCVDYRVGAAGAYRITANEVTLGLTMPRAAVEICRQRLTPSHFHRALSLAEVYSPAGAVEAGFLDEVVEQADLAATAHARAVQLLALDARRPRRHEIAHARARPRGTGSRPCRRQRGAREPASSPAPSRRCPERSSARRSFAIACCRCGLAMLAQEGVGALTTRAVARAAGTSVPAVYELFGDKAGLVREMFFTGFRRLHQRLLERETASDPLTDLVQLAMTFRAFAREEPMLSQLMFSRAFAEFDPGPADARAGAAVRGYLVDRVDAARARRSAGRRFDRHRPCPAGDRSGAGAPGERRLARIDTGVARSAMGAGNARGAERAQVCAERVIAH